MAYDTEELIWLALAVISYNKLMFIEDIRIYMGISRQTYYSHGLDDMDIVKEEILSNKIRIKQGLRSKWFKSDAPALQIALMKLLASKDELKRLTNQDITSDGDKLNVVVKPPVVVEE